MTNNEIKMVNNMKNQYSLEPKKITEIDKLKELDKRAKRPAQIFSYALGTVGALVLGTGMTMAMELIPGGMIAGVAIGCVGMIIAGCNYKLHGMILNSRKKKYSKEILDLTDNILNNK